MAQPPSSPPELQPPFISISGLSNFRDIGGWPIPPSSAVRSGILYRGPDLTSITSTGIAQLHALGIKVIFDLRSTPQITRAGGAREIEGITRVWCPVFGAEEYSQEKAGRRYVQYASEGTEGIVQAFLEILTHGAHPAFRPILQHLATPSPAPCMLHCTTGNNRSGAFIGVLLSLLGVPAEQIAEEYALSEIGLRADRDMVVERLLRNPKFKAACGEGEDGRRGAERMVGA
ncbi:Tyrosine-protein phosphatase, partial [Lachnellula suecica]